MESKQINKESDTFLIRLDVRWKSVLLLLRADQNKSMKFLVEQALKNEYSEYLPDEIEFEKGDRFEANTNT
jgi:hypothetical protein